MTMKPLLFALCAVFSPCYSEIPGTSRLRACAANQSLSIRRRSLDPQEARFCAYNCFPSPVLDGLEQLGCAISRFDKWGVAYGKLGRGEVLGSKANPSNKPMMIGFMKP